MKTEYTGAYVTSAGRSNIPASLPVFDSKTEKKFIKTLISDLNQNLISGRDTEPNLSRRAARPAMYTAMRTGAVEKALFVGGSNAQNLSQSASALGLDAYKITKGGWKLTRENVDQLIPVLRETLAGLPADTPVVLFCMDNTSFLGLNEDGSMNTISRTRQGTQQLAGAAEADQGGLRHKPGFHSDSLATIRQNSLLRRSGSREQLRGTRFSANYFEGSNENEIRDPESTTAGDNCRQLGADLRQQLYGGES
jgi:hypothetical protein